MEKDLEPIQFINVNCNFCKSSLLVDYQELNSLDEINVIFQACSLSVQVKKLCLQCNDMPVVLNDNLFVQRLMK